MRGDTQRCRRVPGGPCRGGQEPHRRSRGRLHLLHDDYEVVRVRATPVRVSCRWACSSPMLGTSERFLTPMFTEIRDRMLEHAGGRRILLCVDDIDQLDDASAVLIHQMVTAGEALLLATLRTGTHRPRRDHRPVAPWRAAAHRGGGARARCGPVAMADERPERPSTTPATTGCGQPPTATHCSSARCCSAPRAGVAGRSPRWPEAHSPTSPCSSPRLIDSVRQPPRRSRCPSSARPRAPGLRRAVRPGRARQRRHTPPTWPRWRPPD